MPREEAFSREKKRFVERRSVCSREEAFYREKKRSIERRSVFSRENASSLKKTLLLSRKRFFSRENASSLEKTLLLSRKHNCQAMVGNIVSSLLKSVPAKLPIRLKHRSRTNLGAYRMSPLLFNVGGHGASLCRPTARKNKRTNRRHRTKSGNPCTHPASFEINVQALSATFAGADPPEHVEPVDSQNAGVD